MGIIRAMFSLISFLAARKQILESWTLQQTFCTLDDSKQMIVCFIKVIIVNTKKPGEKLHSSKDKSLKPFTFRLQILPTTRLNRFIQVSNLHWSVLPPSVPIKPRNNSLAHWLTRLHGEVEDHTGRRTGIHQSQRRQGEMCWTETLLAVMVLQKRLLAAFFSIKWMQTILWSKPKENEEKQHFRACLKHHATVLINTILWHGERHSEWAIPGKHHPKYHSECPCASTWYQIAKRSVLQWGLALKASALRMQ